MFWPNTTAGYQGYQPDIRAFYTPDSMSSHPLSMAFLQHFFSRKDIPCLIDGVDCVASSIVIRKGSINRGRRAIKFSIQTWMEPRIWTQPWSRAAVDEFYDEGKKCPLWGQDYNRSCWLVSAVWFRIACSRYSPQAGRWKASFYNAFWLYQDVIFSHLQ